MMLKPTYNVLSRTTVDSGTYCRVTFNPIIDLVVVQEVQFWNAEKKEIETRKIKKDVWAETHTYFVRNDQKEEEVLSNALWNHQKQLEKIKESQGETVGKPESYEALPLSKLEQFQNSIIS